MDVFFFYIYDDATDTTVPVSVDDINIENEELEFFNYGVRKVWHKGEQEWYFSIVDVVQVLSDSNDPKQYIKKMRSRDSELNSNWGTICTLLALKSSDGKMHRSMTASTEHLLRIIQSIPSKKAAPFKLWLAQVGKERLDEMADPELAFERAIRHYREKGYSEAWIAQRLEGIGYRKKLTAEWDRADVKAPQQYAALTSILTKSWSGKTVKEYKDFKHLHKESLRDSMTDIELTLNQLAEISATALSKVKNPHGFDEAKNITLEGGHIARNTRKELEEKLGRSVISPVNADTPDLLDHKEK